MAPNHDFDVAIVGAGFCGTMLAVRLARHTSIRVALYERDTFARGIAYSTNNPRHLLNLTAQKMSAFPERLDDFVRWSADYGPEDFVPRSIYAGYLRSIFDRVRKGTPNLTCFKESVTDIQRDSDGFRLHSKTRSTRSRSVVLAIGLFPPGQDFVGADARRSPHFVKDPWAIPFDRLRGNVFIIGSGLTAIDVLVELEHRGFSGHVTMLSRHGLAPAVHGFIEEPVPAQLDKRTALSMLRSVRDAIALGARTAVDWRAIIDDIRPLSQDIWQQWPLREKQRFLAHLRPYWETSRRRVPPSVAKAVDGLEANARLTKLAGRIQEIETKDGGGFVIQTTHRGSTARFEADWLINCTGPQADVAAVPDPLLESLLRQGLIEPHPTRLGIEATPDGRVIDRHGGVQAGLYAIGSMMRGVLYETVSVPELRVQVEQLAKRLIEQMTP